MAKARITFNDGTARTLQSDYPEPACRFANWTPKTIPDGDAATVLATRQRYMFRTAWLYGATFQLEGLGMGAAAASALDLANKLIAHLLNGGTCAVYTEDALGSSYTTCCLMPDTEPSLVQTDRENIEYVLTIALLNVAASPVEMICHYKAA